MLNKEEPSIDIILPSESSSMEHRSSIRTMLPGARLETHARLPRRLCNKEIFSCLKRVIPLHASALLKLELSHWSDRRYRPCVGLSQTRESKRVRRRPRSPRALSAAWNQQLKPGNVSRSNPNTAASRTIDSL